jgi:hypothetical protein
MVGFVQAFVIIRGWGALGSASSAVKRIKTNGSDKDLSKPSRSAMAFDFVSKLVLDFMVIFVPTLACLTLLADWVLTVAAGVYGILLTTVLCAQWSQQQSPKVKPSPKEQVKSSQKAYLSSYRFVMVCGCLLRKGVFSVFCSLQFWSHILDSVLLTWVFL